VGLPAQEDGAASDAPPACVQLVATRALPAGAHLCLDYGGRWLRRWAAAYGFVPSDGDASELFEEVDDSGDEADAAAATEDDDELAPSLPPRAPRLALLAEGGARGGALRLAEVRLRTGRGSAADCSAAVCFVVRDVGACGAGAAALTLLDEAADATAAPRRLAALQPAHEAALCGALAARAEAALARLAARAAALPPTDSDAPAAQLAGALRAARAELLARVAADMRACATLLAL
jgi:hypothetical protein